MLEEVEETAPQSNLRYSAYINLFSLQTFDYNDQLARLHLYIRHTRTQISSCAQTTAASRLHRSGAGTGTASSRLGVSDVVPMAENIKICPVISIT